MPEPVTESIEIAASPVAVYDLVSDVANMGKWSPEATGARRAPKVLAVGDRFVGLNKRGFVRWFTQCRVESADRGRRFEFLVDFGPMPVSSWLYEFEPTETGCRVAETWLDRREGPLAVPIKAFGQLLIPGSRPEHNRRNIQITLQRLKAAAEG